MVDSCLPTQKHTITEIHTDEQTRTTRRHSTIYIDIYLCRFCAKRSREPLRALLLIGPTSLYRSVTGRRLLRLDRQTEQTYKRSWNTCTPEGIAIIARRVVVVELVVVAWKSVFTSSCGGFIKSVAIYIAFFRHSIPCGCRGHRGRLNNLQ